MSPHNISEILLCLISGGTEFFRGHFHLICLHAVSVRALTSTMIRYEGGVFSLIFFIKKLIHSIRMLLPLCKNEGISHAWIFVLEILVTAISQMPWHLTGMNCSCLLPQRWWSSAINILSVTLQMLWYLATINYGGLRLWMAFLWLCKYCGIWSH